MSATIRRATEADGVACADVYAPYVRETAITFETEPPTAEQMAGRIASSHEWLVAEDGGRVVGYAYGTTHRQRAAYAWACEVSVYLEMGLRRTGLGRALYEDLFPRLVDRGYLTAVAGMTLPNPASQGLHASLGFEPVGTYRQIGFKHGSWHDVAWVQRELAPRPDQPAAVR